MFPQYWTLTLSFRLTPGSHIWSPHSQRTPFINLGITLPCCLPTYVCRSRRVHERREKQTKVALQTDSGKKKGQVDLKTPLTDGLTLRDCFAQTLGLPEFLWLQNN